jgi:hypothetical protein
MKLKISYEVLHTILDAFETKSKLSIYKQELVNNDLDLKDFMDDKNQLKSEYFHLFEVLSNPGKVVELKFQKGPFGMIQRIYSNSNGNVSVSLGDEDLYISEVHKPLVYVDELKNHLGQSNFISSPMKLELSFDEALLFFLMVDTYRKSVFKAYSDDELFTQSEMSKENLETALEELKVGSQDFTSYLMSMEEEVTLDKNIINKIEKLTNLGLTSGGDTLLLEGNGLLFAGNFLLIENLLSINVITEKEEVEKNKLFVLQCGPTDLILIEKHYAGYYLETLSSNQVIELVSNLI